MTENENNNLFGEVEIEEDQPIDSFLESTREDKLMERKLEAEEKDKKRKEKRYFSAI